MRTIGGEITARLLVWMVATSVVAAQGSGRIAAPVVDDDPIQTRTIAAGVHLEVLLQTPLNSATARPESRFEAALVQKHEVKGQVVLDVGVPVRGFVSSVKASSKINRQAQLTLSFDSLQMGATPVRVRATVVDVLDPRRADQLKRLDTAPVSGGIPGSAVPLVGVFVRPGGTILSTNGADIDLPVGVILRIRLDQSVSVPAVR